MKQWDAIIVGAGIIGLALARELSKRNLRVLVLERGEPAGEATHAAAGMLAFGDPESSACLQELKMASARLYPEFIREVQDESRMNVDFRREGTVAAFAPGEHSPLDSARPLALDDVRRLEPKVDAAALASRESASPADGKILFLPEQTVDNRALGRALVPAARHRGIDIVTGAATALVRDGGRVAGVRSGHGGYRGAIVINCAGAWAGAWSGAGELGVGVPVVPRKGQMLAVVSRDRELLRHALRGHDVYLVPRSDGRILIGATVEDAGFDKRVDLATIQRLYHAAMRLLPPVADLPMQEAWAGLRPATSDGLPAMGATTLPGYFIATGHFRNGILLAPVTAQLMAQVLVGEKASLDLRPYSPLRFAPSEVEASHG